MKKLCLCALAVLIATPVFAWRAGSPRKTIQDGTAYTVTPYQAFGLAFGAGGLIRGTDYSEQISVIPGAFPSGTAASWSWPSGNGGVRSAPGINYGDYNGGPFGSITSRTVNSITTLMQTHSLSIGGTTSGFDVIADYFLTSAARSDSTKLYEIEVFFHTPSFAATYVLGGTAVGTFTDSSGTAWTVTQTTGGLSTPDYNFMPANQGDLLSYTFDHKAALLWLKGLGKIAGTEFFNGFLLGAETVMNSGSLTFNSFAVTYN